MSICLPPLKWKLQEGRASQYCCPSLLQVLRKCLQDGFVSGRPSGEVCVTQGPEGEKELLVNRGDVRGPGVGNNRCGDSITGKRNGKQPSVVESG